MFIIVKNKSMTNDSELTRSLLNMCFKHERETNNVLTNPLEQRIIVFSTFCFVTHIEYCYS